MEDSDGPPVSAGATTTQGPGVNDLDLLRVDDPAGDDPVQPSPPTPPREVRLFRPAKGKYSIVVFNYMGRTPATS